MQSTITSLIESRASVNHFDTSRQLTDAQITELARLATLAPSAYNFQNWKFIAVRAQPAKERLKAVAYNQQKVTDAAVTFIICGTLNAHEGLPRALQPSVDAGILPQPVVDSWVAMASSAHPGNPQLQRDEAVRSASLAAMTLMLAAEGMGLVTCPMSGFDAAGVAREFNLSEREVPVMLVTVGYAAQDNWPPKRRKPLSEVLELA
ncbi:nitroreductase family protein [Duganella sp. FT92W]|uniref:Nitroreductase family protein n=1 Tax=Pseudoduganella rivuli TaxID=2666085 RepID=A0A7X2LRE5_9BURK|nr:nitroreductase family protein [Pseudoduganella rivuli]MRV72375.1 nitroreductase family protein [Pseudoduganella rivuli]